MRVTTLIVDAAAEKKRPPETRWRRHVFHQGRRDVVAHAFVHMRSYIQQIAGWLVAISGVSVRARANTRYQYAGNTAT